MQIVYGSLDVSDVISVILIDTSGFIARVRAAAFIMNINTAETLSSRFNVNSDRQTSRRSLRNRSLATNLL